MELVLTRILGENKKNVFLLKKFYNYTIQCSGPFWLLKFQLRNRKKKIQSRSYIIHISNTSMTSIG